MRFTHLFIDRPILATVISVFLTLVGLGALVVLPVAQYPEIVPPTVQITTSYPGASADVVSQTVATPLEQEINGVEDMIYMSSQSTGDGKLTITVTFRIGTDLNVAQMLTQNRVQDALPRLPQDVQRLGVRVVVAHVDDDVESVAAVGGDRVVERGVQGRDQLLDVRALAAAGAQPDARPEPRRRHVLAEHVDAEVEPRAVERLLDDVDDAGLAGARRAVQHHDPAGADIAGALDAGVDVNVDVSGGHA